MAQTVSAKIRIAAIPALLALIAVAELRHGVSFFRLITFFLVFLLLADVASLLSGGLRNAFVILASLAFGLCLVEATANILEPKQVVTSTDGWAVRQPVIGWGPQRAGVFHASRVDPKTGATVFSVDYTIDSNLVRLTRSREAGPAIVFFGDSYTFGYGVDDADTMPQVFADLFNGEQRVVNLGITGHGPQQFLRELETGHYDAAVGPQPKLFIYLTSPWHAERTACKAYWVAHAPLYAVENDKVVFKGVCNEGASLLLREWLQNTAAYRWFIEPYRHRVSHDDVELYVRILSAAVELAREKYGVQTVVPYLAAPQSYLAGAGFTNESIMQRLRDGGALVIDASLDKEAAAGALISIPVDGHPTPFAHRARAVMLKTYLEENMSGILFSRLQ